MAGRNDSVSLLMATQWCVALRKKKRQKQNDRPDIRTDRVNFCIRMRLTSFKLQELIQCESKDVCR